MSEVKLPPLPVPADGAEWFTYTPEDMREYGEACARAALEAAANVSRKSLDDWMQGASGTDNPSLAVCRYNKAEAASTIYGLIRALSVGSGGSGR